MVLLSIIGAIYLSNKVPVNYILLGIFTLGESLSVASVAAKFDPTSVTLAIAFFLALTVFLFIASMLMRDSSNYALTMIAAIVAGCGVQCILIPLVFSGSQWNIVLVSLLVTLIFCAYVVVDLHLLANRVSVDEYIIAAIMIYFDLLRIFIFILQILAKRK